MGRGPVAPRASPTDPPTYGACPRGLPPSGRPAAGGLAEPRAVLAVASQMMRRILVDRARANTRGRAVANSARDARRCGRRRRATPGVDVLDLDVALEPLPRSTRARAGSRSCDSSPASRSKRPATPCVSAATVERDWQAARAWLFRRSRRVLQKRAMTPDRCQEIDRAWHAVLARPRGDQRAAAVAELCAGDDALRREVVSLLESLGQASAAGFRVAPGLHETRTIACVPTPATSSWISGA